MKVILTGENSYIANRTCELLRSFGHDAQCISVRNGIDELSLKGVDAVVHCAAIVHKDKKESINKYYKVNYELTAELAELALEDGVKHFVYLSTMSVYGDEPEEINSKTPLRPTTVYGKSKLKAEKAVMELNSEEFKVTVLRPPMVYGEGCRGNYNRLKSFAKWNFVVPDTQNVKSLIYIDNLTNFICEVIEDGLKGIFNIMDGEYTSTADLVVLMGQANNRRILKSRILGKILMLFKKLSIVRKAFGTLYYDDTTAVKLDYYSMREAVFLTEGNKNFELPGEEQAALPENKEKPEVTEEEKQEETEAREEQKTDAAKEKQRETTEEKPEDKEVSEEV